MFSLPLIIVFSFDLSLTAFLPAAATGAGDEADMLVFALADEEETSITPEGQTGRNSLHMASFHGPAVEALREQLSYSIFQLITTRLNGSKREQDTQMER